ncbi:hypothetical protein CKA55_11875 [Arcobacter suis]|uniref:Uncharacterized protein n=1 Tax=Arcobacter suis CECT 7833 TaxID=663365 RepID=A0AAD0WR44_9BACT|nr:hypothetical protein [Arcobacter suis]AXX90451.1 hypothetical protein ASUIS_1990 [Arcobacter suis CECT 7833]RWS45621.1 hypothetical protein CKA55_11875 [Arcobacter suis]
MDIVLCTNNKFEDPFLHSQLLKIYDEISLVDKKYLFCRNRKEKDSEEIINIEFGKISFVVYFIKLLFFTFKINSSKTVYHIRGFVSAFIFYFVQKILFWKKVSYIYDPRGAFVTELSESKFASQDNFILRILRFIEKSIIKHSIKTIVTTERFKNLYKDYYENSSKYVVLYNTSALTSLDFVEEKLVEKDCINICYIGSIDHWHNLDEISRVLKYTQDIIPQNTKVYFFTNYPNREMIKEKLSVLMIKDFTVKFIPYEEVEKNLTNMDICISVVEPTKSQLIASPIKISDYIQLNKIIISNKNIGDFDDFFIENNSVQLYEYAEELNFNLDELDSLNREKNEVLKKRLNIQNNIVKIEKILSEYQNDSN